MKLVKYAVKNVLNDALFLKSKQIGLLKYLGKKADVLEDSGPDDYDEWEKAAIKLQDQMKDLTKIIEFLEILEGDE